MANLASYMQEQNGVVGPRQKQLADLLGGGTAGPAAPAAPASLAAPPIQDAPAAPAFDAAQHVGHNGTTSKGLTREQYRDKWQGSGAVGTDALKNFLAENGGVLQSGNGTVLTPFGEQIDMMQGARTGRGVPAWGGVGDSGGSAAPALGGGAPDLRGLLQGDSQASIQQALGALQQSGRLQQLIAALGGQV